MNTTLSGFGILTGFRDVFDTAKAMILDYIQDGNFARSFRVFLGMVILADRKRV